MTNRSNQTDQITAVITTYNEERNIKDCINAALLLTENIILVDTGSSDLTVDFARKTYPKIKIIQKGRISYVEQVRELSIRECNTDWVFLMDADERISKELVEEIKREISSNNEHTHFLVKRKNIFAGKKWLKYGGWYPDKQLRLIKKSAFISWPSRIHSQPELQGEVGELRSDLIHHFHPSLENMLEKTAVYENIEAEMLYKAKKDVKTITFFRKFFGELYRRLIKQKGFLDGRYGIIESLYQAFSKTITYLMLYEKYQKNKKDIAY